MTSSSQGSASGSRRPPSLSVARGLFIGSAVVWMPVIPHLGGSNEQNGSLPLLLLVLQIVFGVLATGGRPWARVAVSITTALLILLVGPYIWLGPDDPTNAYGTAYAVMDLVGLIGSGAAIALLHSPAGREYFRTTAT